MRITGTEVPASASLQKEQRRRVMTGALGISDCICSLRRPGEARKTGVPGRKVFLESVFFPQRR